MTYICPFSPGCLSEMAFAKCFQEVLEAISVLTELDASGKLQSCCSDEPLPPGQIGPVELMVADISEVSALPCHLQELGPDKPEGWIDQVFQLGETRPTARQPVRVHGVLTSDECTQHKKKRSWNEKGQWIPTSQ